MWCVSMCVCVCAVNFCMLIKKLATTLIEDAASATDQQSLCGG